MLQIYKKVIKTLKFLRRVKNRMVTDDYDPKCIAFISDLEQYLEDIKYDVMGIIQDQEGTINDDIYL